MKRIPTIVAIIFLALSSSAQVTTDADTLWKFNGVTSLSVSQLSLANWAAGGENSVSGNALLQLSGDYDDGTLSWDNDLIMGYGLIRQGDDPSRKSNDKVDIASKLGYRASKNWFFSALLSFKTQFAEGYDDPGEVNRNKISNRLAPGYLNLSAGMDFKPNDKFAMLLAPVTGKMTSVMDDDLSAAGLFGLEPGQTIRSEFGGYIKVSYKNEIMKNVLVDTKLDLFTNYLENPQYVDVNWDMLLTLTVNEYISATLVTQLIYDRDIDFGSDTTGDGVNDTFEPRVQFKELFGLGITYNF